MDHGIAILTGILVALAGIGSGAMLASETAAATAHTPSPDCGDGPGSGAVFIADSGFVVIDDSNGTMPDDGPFVNDATIHIGDVTLSADGNASTNLETAMDSVCLAAVNASEIPIQVKLGDDTLVVDGAADVLALGDITYADDVEGVDIAYDAGAPLDITLPDTSLPSGTTVEAIAVDSGQVLVVGTVDGDGSLSLTFPPDSVAVDLVALEATDSGTGSGTPTATKTETPTTTLPETVAETKTKTEVAEETPTETPIATLPEPVTETKTKTEVAEETPTETPAETEDDPLPISWIAGALGALAAAALLAWRLRR